MRRMTVLRLAAAAILATTASIAAPAGQAPDAPPAPRTIEDVLGPDDGFGVSLQIGGDFMSAMEPCGCKVPMGGVEWRASYAKTVAAKAPGVAVVQLDAGNQFQTAYPPGYAHVDDLAIKNDWVLRAAQRIDLRAGNVTALDLPYLAKMYETAGYDARKAQNPVLDRFVSANVVPADASHKAFKPYVIEEVKAPRLGAAPLRVGVIGVTEIPKAGASVAGYTIGDPFAALKKYAPEVRKQCDVLVVLAYVEKKAMTKIEPSAGVMVDVIAVAHRFPPQVLDMTVDAPVYTYPATEGKAVSEIRLYPAAAGARGRYGRVQSRYVAMTGAIPHDEDARKFMYDAAKAYRTATPSTTTN